MKYLLFLLLAACAGQVGDPPAGGVHHLACTQFDQFVPESQLFSYTPSGARNYPVKLLPPSGYTVFHNTTVTNELNTSPALAWGKGEKQHFITPQTSFSFDPGTAWIKVQQTFDNFDNGQGIGVNATVCQ